jgi:hypothetical protein
VICTEQSTLHTRLQPLQEQLPQPIQFHGMLTLQFPTISIVIGIVIECMKMICGGQSVHQSIFDLDSAFKKAGLAQDFNK